MLSVSSYTIQILYCIQITNKCIYFIIGIEIRRICFFYLLQMGIKNIIETAKAMGIKSPLDDAPSLSLGASDVNLLELANAYSTVANEGKAHPEAILVTRILDRDGNEVYVAPNETEQAISVKSAYYMQQMLRRLFDNRSSCLR